MNGGQVQLYDLSDPSAPAKLGSIATGLSGIGALSFDGSHVLVGEMNGLRAALIDVTNPATPTLVSVTNTGIASIASIALSGTRAVAAGPNDDTVDFLDYTNPSAPTRVSFRPNLTGPYTADLDGSHAAIGDQGGTQVVFVDAATRAVLGTADTTLASLSSVSIDGSRVVASSTNELNVAVVDFSTPSSPTVKMFKPGSGGGSAVVQGGGVMAVGAVLGTSVALVSVVGTPTALGTANSVISSIASLAVTDFTPPPQPGKISASAASLTFGSVAVCMSGKQSVTVKNIGKGKLTISSIAITGPYTVTPATPTSLVPNAAITLTVTFTPTVAGPAPGTLRITSDDPVTPVLTVSLVGTALPTPPPEIDVPSSLFFGASLPKYFFGKRLTITNKGPCVPLTVHAISTGNPVFPVTNDPAPTTIPTTLAINNVTIPPGQSRQFVVVFAPPAVGDFHGTLTITSDDPKRPTVSVDLSGSAVLAKPTAACLVLDRGTFMAFDVGGIDRMDLLKSAVRLFVELMPEEQGDFIGSVIFEYVARRFTAIAPSNPATKALLLTRLPGLAAGYGNDVEDGIAVGMDELGPDLDFLDPPVPPVRSVLLVFTAGGPVGTSHLDAIIPQVVGLGVEVYAIAMGLGTYADPDRLSKLAASSKGKFFAADDTLLLRKNFVQVLADAFRMNLAADPIDTIARGQTREVAMHVTRCERRLKFVCTWEDLQQQLTLELVAPDGTRFTPASPATNRLVRYATQPGSAFFDLLLPPLEADDVIGPQVVGIWHLRVIATHLVADSARFSTALLVESPVAFRSRLEQMAILESSRVHFDLVDGESPIPGAQVAVTLLAPRESNQAVQVRRLARARRRAQEDPSGGSVAIGSLPDDVGSEVARDTGVGPTPRPVEVARAAEIRPSDVLDLPNIAFEQLDFVAEPTRDFQYAVTLPALVTDGIHQLIVQTRAPACGGTVTRYAHLAFTLAQTLDPSLSGYAISKVPAPGEPVELILTPRDRAGNLLGPSKADRFTLSVRGEGAVIGGIVDRWDGSYLVRVARAQPTTMTLVLQIGSVEQAIRLPRRLEILYFTQPIRRLVARLIAWWRVRAARSKWPK